MDRAFTKEITALSGVFGASFILGGSPALPAQSPLAMAHLPPPALEQRTSVPLFSPSFSTAPCQQVLDYLSREAGLIVLPHSAIPQTLSLGSGSPVDLPHLLHLLNTELASTGLTAVLSDRFLSIIPIQEALRSATPVRFGNRPERVPKTATIATQIIPLLNISAEELPATLTPLLPVNSVLSASREANALVLTSNESAINRLLQIVQALDHSQSTTTEISVQTLRYADAKNLSLVLNELFSSSSSRNSSGASIQNPQYVVEALASQMGIAPVGLDQNAASFGTQGFLAVADEYSNSVLLRCSPELGKLAKSLVGKLDVDVQGVFELRIFHLRNADPSETAYLLGQLFPQHQQSTQEPFSAPPQFDPQLPSLPEQTSRTRDLSTLIAVPDPRTGSLVLIAHQQLLATVQALIERLDADPARRQKLHVIELQHADPAQVEGILRDLFPSPTQSSSASRTSPLQNRVQQSSQPIQQGTMGGRGSTPGSVTSSANQR